MKPLKKIIVAVHGIGDQARNATALATTIRFCDHFQYPGMVSLGAFYGALTVPPGQNEPRKPLRLAGPPNREPLTDAMGFAEVYWADIPRRIDKEAYTLQETKAWALTIVNRVRVLATNHRRANEKLDYPRIKLVLQEMIEAIAVIESLLFLSRKAGLFDFDLQKTLNAFLGDVQIVTEFPEIRDEILAKFSESMVAIHTLSKLNQLAPDYEIHLVAHSEGTVVSFLGLLRACQDPTNHPWIEHVRGYMTLGSPIDKHLILWPDLFKPFERVPTPAPTTRSPPEIRWLNYVDYSDPVGFNLNTARIWLEKHGYDERLKFDEADDYSFRRYPFPGKAHVDYWDDPEVFGHFIRKVVNPHPPHQPPTPSEQRFLDEGPALKPWVPFVTYVVSYLVPLALIHLGVYILLKAVAAFQHPTVKEESPHFIACVLGLSWLVCGTTIWLRLVRLTRSWGWFLLGVLLYAGMAFAFLSVTRTTVSSLTELAWFSPTNIPAWAPVQHPAFVPLAATAALILLILVLNSRIWRVIGAFFRHG